MNLHSALVVLHRHGFADLHGERLHDSAIVFVEAVQAAMEGLDTHDIAEALRWAFQDDRPDMQKRLMACLGFLVGRLQQQAEGIRLATPEDWKRVAIEGLMRDPSSCAICMTHVKPEQTGNVYNCPQCGATYVRNGNHSAWRRSHIIVPALTETKCRCVYAGWGQDIDKDQVHTCKHCGTKRKLMKHPDGDFSWEVIPTTARAPDSATQGPSGPTE